jgi:hypothetical protein
MSTPTNVADSHAAPRAVPRARTTPRAGGLELRPFLAIVCGFWLYATVSAVLFAYGLDVNISRETGTSIFAPWPTRVAQYVMLLPPLMGCYWWSLRLGWQPLWRKLPSQLALALAFALLARPAFWASMRLFGEAKDEGHSGWMAISDWIGPELFVWLASFSDFLVRYGFGLALVTGFAVYKQFRDTELRFAAIGRELSAARLAALRMQLSPHTLFNLLHTIRGQIAWDPGAAQTMVVQLADLLRRLLNAGEREFSRLADELHFARLYLELQRSRFADRLTVELPPPESVPDVWVPSLILQPIVENAVTHGLAGHDGPVKVSIAARTEADVLQLTVTNDMAADHRGVGGGLGLRNVRERLAVQFGRRARLEAGPRSDGTWVATIALPVLTEMPRSTAPSV